MVYAKKLPTPEAVLATIKPGCLYCAHHISRKFSIPSSDIAALLASMVSKGLLSRVKPNGRRNSYYCQPGSEPSFEKHTIDETMAQPRTYAVLTGEIAGYGAEMERYRALAMMTRAR